MRKVKQKTKRKKDMEFNNFHPKQTNNLNPLTMVALCNSIRVMLVQNRLNIKEKKLRFL